MENFRRQEKFNESIYEVLECAFDNECQECITDEIIRSIKYSDMEKVLEILVSQKLYDEKVKRHLKHFKDTSIGLYCTDRPEKVNDPEKMLFELK